jgi:segregation and condensation protein B
MSKRSRKNSEESAATGEAGDATMSESFADADVSLETRAASGDTGEDSREEAVAELSDAIEALGDGSDGALADGGGPAPGRNWADHVDPSGTSADGDEDFEEDDDPEDDDDEDDESDDDEDDAAAVDDDAVGADDDEREVVIHDADAEDREEEFARMGAEMRASEEAVSADEEVAPGAQPRELAELMSICEALIFVSEEPLTLKTMSDVLGEDKGWVQVAVEELSKEFNERNGGLMLREVAGGWQFATRPEHHEHVRAYLKSKPSAKLSLAALETLAVIAYKQPITVPEILEIRGVQSSSAIKTLLDKRLIIAKGRKETIGRPMMYGTSKDFLLQFGLRDLTELPNVEDFEDLASGGEMS